VERDQLPRALEPSERCLDRCAAFEGFAPVIRIVERAD
jgi:hypothetical protein